MKPSSLVPVLVTVIWSLGASAAPATDPAAESLTAWQWYQEIRPPATASSHYVDFVLTPGVFGRARVDLADLRLYDAGGREVPYVVRVRRARDEQETLSARTFNQTRHADRSAEIRLDLGERVAEHNAIDVVTAGNDFRRRLRLEGSDTGKSWSTLLDKVYLVHFLVDGRQVLVQRHGYPASRFRYLRVLVFPDTGLDADQPRIEKVQVLHRTQVPGEYRTAEAHLRAREAVRTPGGAPGSAWAIDFGGDTVPCERLQFDVADQEFSRSYVLQTDNPGEPRRTLASGHWGRRAGAKAEPLEIRFGETLAQRLRLVVTDFRNPPLTLNAVRYTAPVRQVIFAREAAAGPLRLYFGNSSATATHYDFAAHLPTRLDPAPAHATVEGVSPNPDYHPAPRPLTERWPWLVYVVLSAASVVLLIILAALAHRALPQPEAT